MLENRKKKDKLFQCNQPCGCWIGNPKVHSSMVKVLKVKDDWKAVESNLDRWKVSKELKQNFKSGMLFEGSGFQNFDFFYRKGNDPVYAMAIGAIRRINKDTLQIGYLQATSYTWLASKWKTKWVSYTDWEGQYRGDYRQPKNKKPEGVTASEIKAITGALKHVAFQQLDEEINKKYPKRN